MLKNGDDYSSNKNKTVKQYFESSEVENYTFYSKRFNNCNYKKHLDTFKNSKEHAEKFTTYII